MSFLREKLEKKFADEYAKLNGEQRTAVDAIEGPVMVIAGPGTGKTQILACRIGKILLETDAQPQNILCLTYTDAGVMAMRKRLLSFIGSEAYKINIHTFHSFCNTVIQENSQYFYNRDLEPVSDLEKIQFLYELIDGFENGNPLKRYRGDIYHDADRLAGLFTTMKLEAWQPEWMLEEIDNYIKEINSESGGFYNKTKLKKGILELTANGKGELKKMETLKAAIQSFNSYQQILQKYKRYDFSDMINWVIQLFQEQPDVLLNYQEQYQYILVDEYQDSNGSQNKLVELLISYWQDESPNIFVVGDDDQSIYRFQGANLKNMMNIVKRFEKDLLKVVLTKNYRSVQPILDSAKGLIEHNKQRLVYQFKDLSKDLIASKPELQKLNILPEIRVYESEFSENAHVTSSIKSLIEQGTPPGNIAVIYKENKNGDELLKFFQLQNIPSYSKRSVNLLNDVLICQIINLIKYTVAELDEPFSGEPLLFEILHYPFLGMVPFEIAAMCTEIAEKRKGVEETTLRGYLKKIQPVNKSLFEADDPKQKAGKFIEELIAAVHTRTLQQWFEFLINESGILHWAMKQDDRTWQMNKLSCLFDYIKETTHRQPHLTLKELVKQFDLLEENKLPLPLVQTIGTEEGVNIMTCHGSKGLEFEHVFIVNLRMDVWEKKKSGNQSFRIPHNIVEQDSDEEMHEELRRLFFVSVTRAEKYLYLSYSKMKNDGKPIEGSQFVEEFRETLQLEPKLIRLTEAEKLLYTSLRFGIIQKPVIQQAEKDLVNRQLEKFVLNVTALNNYLECPIKFYYNTIIRVPAAKSESMAFGTAVHAAIEDFIRKMMNNGKVYPDKEYLITQFRFHLYDSREAFTPESLIRHKERGELALDAYYDKYYVPAPKGDFILTENPFNKIVVNNVPLKGFTDKIQFWGNDIVVTDFKTGKYSNSTNTGAFNLPGSSKNPDGGNYWRQAVFYKILIDNMPQKKWNILYTQFDYVEPNDKGEFDLHRVDIRDEDVEIVKKQIADTWEQIQQHNFYTGCGSDKCVWCNFVKDNKFYISLIEEDDEGRFTESTDTE